MGAHLDWLRAMLTEAEHEHLDARAKEPEEDYDHYFNWFLT